MVTVTPRQIFEFLNYRGEEYQSHVEMLHQEDIYRTNKKEDDGLDDMSFPLVYGAMKNKDIVNIFYKHLVQDNDNETVLDVVDEILRYQTDGYMIHTWFGGSSEVLIVAYRPIIRIQESIREEGSCYNEFDAGPDNPPPTLAEQFADVIGIASDLRSIDEVSIPIKPSSFWYGKGLSSLDSQEEGVSCPVCNKAVLEPEFCDSDKISMAVGCPECGHGFPTAAGISKHGPVL